MNKCHTHFTNIGKFIKNINGNWRNSIYVTCSVCKHKKEECCNDMLVSFDENGIPAMIMAKDADMIFGVITDKSECLCEISNAKFECLFENYLNKNTQDILSTCPILQLTKWELFQGLRE